MRTLKVLSVAMLTAVIHIQANAGVVVSESTVLNKSLVGSYQIVFKKSISSFMTRFQRECVNCDQHGNYEWGYWFYDGKELDPYKFDVKKQMPMLSQAELDHLTLFDPESQKALIWRIGQTACKVYTFGAKPAQSKDLAMPHVIKSVEHDRYPDPHSNANEYGGKVPSIEEVRVFFEYGSEAGGELRGEIACSRVHNSKEDSVWKVSDIISAYGDDKIEVQEADSQAQ